MAMVEVIAATTVMLLLLVVSAAENNSGAISCAKDQVVDAAVTAPRTVVKLKCPSSYTVKPDVESNNVDKVYTDSNCKNTEKLAHLCPGATGIQSTSDSQNMLTMNFQQLPSKAAIFYIQCTGDGGTCKFLVSVAAAPPQGPQVCAAPNGSVELLVWGDGGSAQFACGSQYELYPSSATKAYTDDCKKETDLGDLTRTLNEQKYYVVKAETKPKRQKLCYLCKTAGGKGKGDGSCAVYIHVSAGSGVAAVSAFVLVLPALLALLHFT